jgi:hypothetical protein
MGNFYDQGVKDLKKFWVIILNILLLIVPSLAWAGAGGGKKEALLEKKVDLANLSGLNYFFAKWYNDNLWVYAAITTVLMGVMGIIIALGADVILKAIGMEVHKIEHKE